MSGISRWLRRHPVLTPLAVAGAVLSGSTLDVWIDGALGYVAYGACLLVGVAIVRLYLRRGET